MNIKASRKETKVITGKVRLSYAHLFEPYGMDGQEPKFSTAIVIPKSDTSSFYLKNSSGFWLAAFRKDDRQTFVFLYLLD